MRLHACMSQEGAATARRTAMRLHACTALVPCQQDLNYAPADRLLDPAYTGKKQEACSQAHSPPASSPPCLHVHACMQPPHLLMAVLRPHLHAGCTAMNPAALLRVRSTLPRVRGSGRRGLFHCDMFIMKRIIKAFLTRYCNAGGGSKFSYRHSDSGYFYSAAATFNKK